MWNVELHFIGFRISTEEMLLMKNLKMFNYHLLIIIKEENDISKKGAFIFLDLAYNFE